MAVTGFDYAWDRPDPHCLASAGYRFVSRYLSYDDTGKNLTATEAGALHGAGLDIVLNWEWQKYNAREGYATGVKHGRDAVIFADRVGAPGNLPIYFSVDFDVQSHELPAVAEYFRGVATQLNAGLVGAYGGYNTIDYLYKHNRAKWFWQTYAWSGGKVHSAAHVLQYSNNHLVCGGKGDLNRALKPAFGAWAGRGSSQTPLPAPAAPADTSTGFDYTGDILGTGQTITAMASSVAGYSAEINALRNN